MNRLLAIDTSNDFGSLALAEQGRVLEELPLHSTDGFAHLIFDALDRLLDRHGWRLQDLDGLAAASGPGSFTGIRVCLSAAKGLAHVLGKPMAAVSNLHALASFGSTTRRAVLLDARRGEIYGAVYDADGAAIHAETVMPFPAWVDSLPPDTAEFITQTPSLFVPLLASTRFAHCPVVEAPRTLAAAIARIAVAQAGHDPVALDANYVRRSDAELFWKDAGSP